MRPRSLRRRRAADLAVKASSVFAAGLALFALGWILLEVLRRGLQAIDFNFFTRLPTPAGISGGGMANALVGTFLMTALATALAVPAGILAGVYLGEFGGKAKVAGAVRTASNLLMGTPSIIIGVFVYTLLVVPTGHFSGYAGAAALALIMLPVVARTTEDMVRLVPDTLREAGLALGAPRWKVVLGLVFRTARAGLLTGVLLAVARVSGETAPLLFTALNSPYWVRSLREPTANLTVSIFNYAMSPYADWKAKAWAASLVIMAGVLLLAVVSRWVWGERRTGRP